MNTSICFIAVLSIVSATLAAEMPATRPLFNGKDLSGWSGKGYIVEDGAIICTPEGKNLITEQRFSNYILEFDFKLPPAGNNGIGIHYPGSGDGAYEGMEIQILDNSDAKYGDLKDTQFHGSLYLLAPAKKSGLKPVGEWNREKITVSGNGLIVELNGEIILRANLDELAARNPKHLGAKRKAGHIAMLGHGDRVAFKNIRIAEMAPAANVEGVMAAGFTRLFNGKNLDNWNHGNSAEWIISNGILKHSGRSSKPSDLWTLDEYGDCTLVFDWRWSSTGPMQRRPVVLPDGSEKKDEDGQPVLAEIEELDSGIYLRGNIRSQVNLWNWTVGSGEVHGYRTDASLPAEVRAAVTPKIRADRPVGEWNRTMITLKGDRLSVSLNGRVVIDHAQLPDVPERGTIGIQHQGSAIDFANFWIRQP